MVKYIVARHNNDDSDVVKNYLKESLNDKDHVIEIWHGHSIFEKYNTGIKGWINDPESPLLDNDILCFIHEDIKILDKNFEEKVEYIFSKREKVGVLGIIGSNTINLNGGWWLTQPENQFGHIMQGRPDLSESFHMVKNISYKENIVAIDGCCFFVRGKVAKEILFDDMTYPGYHFYDYDYCFSVLEKGYKVAISDILVEHKSEGPLGDEWTNNRNLFINKWIKKGYIFPIKASSFIR